MEIIYRKDKWFGRFLVLLERKQSIFVTEVKRKIPRKEYYHIVMGEIERLNAFSEQRYNNKIIELRYSLRTKKLEFSKVKNIAIKEVDDFIVITINKSEK
jgi:hypothetical protein